MAADMQVAMMYLRQLSELVLKRRSVWMCMSPPIPKHKTSVYHESRIKYASWTVRFVETIMLKCKTEMAA
jgi:hypothetical protein